MALHEGVAVGAASFYAQATGRTAVANLHVAPGLGNAIGALYGALKANSPLIVTAGQQDTRIRLANPLLAHDLVAMAAPVTKWSVQAERADEIAPILRRAFKVATDAPKGPVFVSLPIDVMEQETSVEPVGPDKLWRSTHPDPRGIEKVASLLLKSARPAIVAGDDVARSGTNEALVALAEAIGASVWFEGLRAHAPFPTSHPNYRQSLPSDAAQVRKVFQDADLIVLLGGGRSSRTSGMRREAISPKVLLSSRSRNRLSAWRSIIISTAASSETLRPASPRWQIQCARGKHPTSRLLRNAAIRRWPI
jgi:benzoylformate decarboxylase